MSNHSIVTPLSRAAARSEHSQQDALLWLLLQHRPPDDVCVMLEVGVYCGETPRRLLPNAPWLYYIGVDPWLPWVEKPGYMELVAARQQALQVQQDFPCRCRLLEMPSAMASTCISNETLDLVFIDASHTYDAAKAEIAHWVNKVKPGGVICGHDYTFQSAVKRAVDEVLPGVRYIGGQADVWWWAN